MKPGSFICLGLWLVGCTTATPINTGTGQQAYMIECPGAARSMSACIEKANSVCPNGYSIVGADQNQSGGMASYNPYLGMFTYVPRVERTLVVSCHGSNYVLPQSTAATPTPPATATTQPSNNGCTWNSIEYHWEC